MNLFMERRLTPCERLRQKLNQNPTWPFELAEGLGPQERLVFTVRYRRFFWGVAACVLSVLLTVALGVADLVDSSFFLWSLLAIVISAFVMLQYHDLRTYIVDRESQTFSFYVGNELVSESSLRNIYIRLRKQRTAGNRAYYYLIVGGYRVDQHQLTAATVDMTTLRRLGQELAANIGINYFDEANVSVHHKVMHAKENTEELRFLAKQ